MDSEIISKMCRENNGEVWYAKILIPLEVLSKTPELPDAELRLRIVENITKLPMYVNWAKYDCKKEKLELIGFGAREIKMCIENLCMIKPRGTLIGVIVDERTKAVITADIVISMDQMAIVLNEINLQDLMKAYEYAKNEEEKRMIIGMMTSSWTEVSVE